MKSITTHRQKKYRTQIVGYLFLLILVIIFISTVGVKILLNTSLFIVKLTQKNKNNVSTVNNEENLILPPEIFDLPEATNSAEIYVTGRGSAKKNLLIYINDELQDELILDADQFETNIKLTKGNNSIYLLLKDAKTKQKKQSKIYNIIYKDEKPVLEISFPQDQEKTNKDEIQVIGATDAEVFIQINNAPVIVDAEGKFSYSVKLQIGENQIIIAATDIAGNTETKELTVIYQKDD